MLMALERQGAPDDGQVNAISDENDGGRARILPGRLDVLSLPDAERIGMAAGLELWGAPTSAPAEAIWKSFQTLSILSPFQRCEWSSGLAEIDCDHAALLVFALDGEELVLLFPLVREKFAFTRRLCFHGHMFNDYNAPLMLPSICRRLDEVACLDIWRKILGYSDCQYAFLEKQPVVIGTFPNPFAIAKARPNSSDAHNLSLRKGWPGCYHSIRRNKRRKLDRRSMDKLRRGQPLIKKRIRAADEIRPLLDNIVRWKVDRLNAQGVPRHPFADGKLQSLLEHLLVDPESHQFARLYALCRGKEIIAAEVVFTHGPEFLLYLIAFDPKYENQGSPGRASLLRNCELAARAGYQSFDFSTGDEPYKDQWCNRHVPLKYSVISCTIVGHIYALISRLRIDVKRYIAQTPPLANLIYKFMRIKRTFNLSNI